MANIKPLADPDYVHEQYQDASRLNARIRLHRECSTNKYGGHFWIFDQIKFKPQCRVLELGCGTGILWLENLERIPPGLDITLSDLSEGMLQQAEQNLKHSPAAFHFKIIDAQSIPFEDHSFDVIIANHMLYHVPDRDKALREISRVLKPDGVFYASTAGANNMKELIDLVSRFDAGLSAWRKPESISFTLENGPPQLAKVFKTITLFRYPDALLVTDANLLADYLLSGALGLAADRRDELIYFIEQEIKANNGKLLIAKDSGILEAKEPLQ